MITPLLVSLSKKTRKVLVESLNQNGIRYLVEMLSEAEKELQQFQLTHSTPELRRLAVKVQRGKAAPEEIELLSQDTAEFSGLLKNGSSLQHEQSIQEVRNLFRNLGLLREFRELLDSMIQTTTVTTSTKIFNVGIQEINSNPRRLKEIMVDFVSTQPKFYLEEMDKLITLKSAAGEVKVMEDLGDLVDYVYGQVKEDVSPITKITASGSKQAQKINSMIEPVLRAAIELDLGFKHQVYEELSPLTKSYHNKWTRWTIYFLSEFIEPVRQRVSSRVTDDMMNALYRVGEEYDVNSRR